MDEVWQIVLAPTPRKSLVCPPPVNPLPLPMNSLWVRRRFAVYISFSFAIIGIWVAEFENSLPFWTVPPLHLNTKPSWKNGGSELEFAPISAAFCSKAVADMLAMWVWFTCCNWWLYSEETPPPPPPLINGGFWTELLPFVPNTQFRL